MAHVASLCPAFSIGRNCVIGAGSIVTKDVPDETVVAGIPARKICTTKEYAERSLSTMPKDFDIIAYESDKRAYLLKKL